MLQLSLKELSSSEPSILSVDSSLHDIVNRVSIRNDFSIHHPDHKLFETPEKVVERLRQLSSTIQSGHLSQFLCNFFYGIYYNSSMKTALSIDSQREDLHRIQDLENSSYLGIDAEFYEQLHRNNAGHGYYDSNWLIVGKKGESVFLVQKDGLTLHADVENHIHPSNRAHGVGDIVSILMPKNLMQSGFYMAVCDKGTDHEILPRENQQTTRIYFNIDADGSPLLMNQITSELNQVSIGFTYKTLYNPSDYGRYDAGVLYIQKSDYPIVYPVLKRVRDRVRLNLNPEIPLFTKELAAGIGLAEEPAQLFSERESFGSHRCKILADGFLESWQSPDDSPQHRLDKILQNFLLMGIDLKKPYLNPDSEDIYTAI
jgi:HopA1 effector protein family